MSCFASFRTWPAFLNPSIRVTSFRLMPSVRVLLGRGPLGGVGMSGSGRLGGRRLGVGRVPEKGADLALLLFGERLLAAGLGALQAAQLERIGRSAGHAALLRFAVCAVSVVTRGTKRSSMPTSRYS